MLIIFFFFDPSTTEIYTLSLHDALPISHDGAVLRCGNPVLVPLDPLPLRHHVDRSALLLQLRDRKSTRLNSSHVEISYAVFCLKKKKVCELALPEFFLQGSQIYRGPVHC